MLYRKLPKGGGRKKSAFWGVAPVLCLKSMPLSVWVEISRLPEQSQMEIFGRL